MKKKASLIIHIGLPKTGTTTLQDNLFRFHKGYLYKHKGLNEKMEIKIREMVFEKKDFNLKEFQHLLREDVIFISDENLSFKDNEILFPSSFTSQSLPIFSVLEKIKKSQEYKNIKVILTLRNQFDWLPSLYSEFSRNILNASEDDFENKVKEIIEGSYLDWSNLIEKIEKIIGEENLCVLLLEEMNKYHYWESLYNFIGSNETLPKIEDVMRAKDNKRKKGHNKWEIQMLTLGGYLREKHKLNYRISLLKEKSIIKSLFNFLFFKKRKRYIYLKEETRMIIENRVNAFNERLSKKLKRDLKSIGY